MTYIIVNKTAVSILVTIRASETKYTFVIIFGPEDGKRSFLTLSKIPPKSYRSFDFLDKTLTTSLRSPD